METMVLSFDARVTVLLSQLLITIAETYPVLSATH